MIMSTVASPRRRARLGALLAGLGLAGVACGTMGFGTTWSGPLAEGWWTLEYVVAAVLLAVITGGLTMLGATYPVAQKLVLPAGLGALITGAGPFVAGALVALAPIVLILLLLVSIGWRVARPARP